MTLEYKEYQTRRIVNVQKHIDGAWFWVKYSAYPYVGCAYGCSFCYRRGDRYTGKRDPELYDQLIGVKTNAVELLCKELAKLEPDVISCGDWQEPAEKRYQLSRGMLEVVHEHGFPLFINVRSPLIIRDLDILKEIDCKSRVVVTYSFSNVDPELKATFELNSPSIQARLQAMEKLSEAGIIVGTALMPILPVVGDDDQHLEDSVRATKDHGGSFILAGNLTMTGVQAKYTLAAAVSHNPALEAGWRKLYDWADGSSPNYAPPKYYTGRIGLKVRELCATYGIDDRIPRYIPPGPLGINKRIAEKLFLRVYELELEGASQYRIWAYRKAAWTVDELESSIRELYTSQGVLGLQSLPNIGEKLAGVISQWLVESGRLH